MTLGNYSQDSTRSRVLVIYTGGTFGMVYQSKGKQLVPFEFEYALDYLPELHRLEREVVFLSLHQPIDSSDITPAIWAELGQIISDRYEQFDGFVILHGTDTMAFTASALSYLLEGLNKPVILTGAQLPVGIARSDARENLLTALEIAATRKDDGSPMVSEVCIFFNSLLLRGNRARKKETSQFNAFYSENYPVLANAGVRIDYNIPYLKPFEPGSRLKLHHRLDTNVFFVKLFPGIEPGIVRSIVATEGLKGIVLETFGAGNAPQAPQFVEALARAVQKGIAVLNVTQCEGGRVVQGQYGVSRRLAEIGVVGGSDITPEAAITKLMFLLGRGYAYQELCGKLAKSLCGEMSA
ncbi:MAG: L-asparaginase 1 [Cytophagaceae bacterium SCN 52-12]|nr:MAG: L-asparaginase 1 [Cytophagaceae bacterium SCN 52-12]